MQFAKIAKIVVAALGLVATVFAVVRGFREYRTPVPKLQAAVVNVEHVSSRTEIPNVKISLAFRDQSVSDLWLCRIRFQNIGGVTLHATGPKPNTQSPLIVSVPEQYEILQIEPKGIDPKDSGFEAQITQRKNDKGVFDKHQLEVTFEQWRREEAIEAVLYLAGSGDHLERPRLIPRGRPILDGDIVPMDLSTVAAPEVKGHVALGKLASLPWLTPVALFAVGSLTVVLFWLVFGDVGGKTPFAKWFQNHPVASEIVRFVLAVGLYIAMVAMLLLILLTRTAKP